jgi:hypothetical protein
VLQDVITALESQNVTSAVEALRLEPSFMQPLDRASQEAFVAGGSGALERIPIDPNTGKRFALGFDGRHPRAEDWVREHAGGLITEIIDNQRQMARTVIESQLERGVNPRTAALDIVGRVNRVTGQREGGFIGLDTSRASRLEIVSEAMKTPDGVRSIVTKSKKDGALSVNYKVNKATEARILRAYRSGERVSEVDRLLSVRQYQSQLLRERGETIARTESITALRAGRHEGFRQLVDSGNIRPDQIVRVWDATGDSRTREDHAQMDGQEIVGIDEPFVAPDGSLMMYPGDTSLGAPAEQTIQCRCITRTRIKYDIVDDEAEAAPDGPEPSAVQSLAQVFADKSADEKNLVMPAFSSAPLDRLAIIRVAGELRGGVASGKGSHHMASNMSIQMNSGHTGEAYRRVMRHEYGHHIDARIEQITMQRAGLNSSQQRYASGASRTARNELKSDAQALEKSVSAKTANAWAANAINATKGFAEKVEADRFALSKKYRSANRSGGESAQMILIKKDLDDRGLNLEQVRQMFPHMFSDDLSASGIRTDVSRFIAAFDNKDHVELIYKGGASMTHSSPLAGLSDSLGAATNQRIGYRFGHNSTYYADFRRYDKKIANFLGKDDVYGKGSTVPTSGRYAYGTGNTAQLWANWFEAYTSGNDTQYSVFKQLFPATSNRFEEIVERFVKDGAI